jgi:hypothetical protein
VISNSKLCVVYRHRHRLNLLQHFHLLVQSPISSKYLIGETTTMSLQLTINYPETLPDAVGKTREQFEQESKWASA